MTKIILEDGKYEVSYNNGVDFKALRYGQPWRDLTGDKFVGALCIRIEEQETEIKELKARLDSIHSWIVCSAIATPEDMMQSAQTIGAAADINQPFLKKD